MTETVVIDERFRGPPESGNGGYSCAMLAQAIEGPAEVTLRVPPPLGRPLAIERGERDGARLLDGDTVVAEAQPAAVDLDVPEPVSLADAERASARYPWHDDHPYPTCFVCGPRRKPGDGLRVFPGPVDGRDLYAAPWTPGLSLADGDGQVRDEFVWSVLDCPSGIVIGIFDDVGRSLLGRLAADLRGPVETGAPHVAVAWPLARDGRKLHTASALFSAEGDVRAVARATWIEVEPKGR